MTLDSELLRRYAEAGAEEAVGELAPRHPDLVHSAALRQVNGDTHLAQDVNEPINVPAEAVESDDIFQSWEAERVLPPPPTR